MLKYTSIVTVPNASLPPTLGLLAAPVELSPPLENPQPDPAYPHGQVEPHERKGLPERVGRIVGVVLDGARHLAHFVVLLDLDHARVLVPVWAADIVTRRGVPVVRLAWSATQLSSQPRFVDEGELPADFERHPLLFWSGPTPVAPSSPFQTKTSLKEAAVGGSVSAAVGGVIGMIAGGPLGAAALAALFGAGGAMMGAMSGGARESAADAKWMYEEAPANGMVHELEQALRDASLFERGILRATPIRPREEVEGRAPQPSAS